VSDRAKFFSSSPWTAGVVGLGYVGLPLLTTAVNNGHPAIGFDVSEQLITALAAGRSHVDDVSEEALRSVTGAGAVFTSDPQALSAADAIFICVPSPLGRNREPDLTYIEKAAQTVAEVARPGQLICLESTTYPGTTEDYIVPAVEKAGLTLDTDVWVAFSPERVSPGDEMKTGDIPKVVGGVTAASGIVAEAAYSRLTPSVHRVSSARAAEMAKLLENTYRAVNIGLVNEMAQLAHELDVDIWEVIDAAATKPFGFQAFYPGPGVGGHCIPLDPQYLAWRAKEANFTTRFIDVAEQVNNKMPSYNVSRIAEMLNTAGLPLRDTEILGVGISYKPNIADDRESAAIEVLKELAERGALVSVLDPVVGSARIQAHGYEPVGEDGDFSRFKLAAVLTDHSAIDYAGLARRVPLVYDARGVYRRMGLEAANVESL
jgi:UDP-N-acetyl-D-glucosamine dehydrogenase